jgi:hypothetical protein
MTALTQEPIKKYASGISGSKAGAKALNIKPIKKYMPGWPEDLPPFGQRKKKQCSERKPG